MDQSPEIVFNLVVFGGIAFILLAIAVAAFSINYQRKVTEQELLRLDQEKTIREKEFQFQRQLLEAVINAQEEEKHRIAEDLHDEIGPLLSLIKLRAGSIKGKVKVIEELPSQVDKITGMLSEAITSVRKISHNLTSGSVEKLGLALALESVADEFNLNASPKFLLELDKELPNLPNQLETIVYRIIMELVQNSLKHGNPKVISLSLKEKENDLAICYSDDGEGFDLNTISPVGMGLKNIEHRVQILNGRKEITTSAGKGFTMAISIPIANL